MTSQALKAQIYQKVIVTVQNFSMTSPHIKGSGIDDA